MVSEYHQLPISVALMQFLSFPGIEALCEEIHGRGELCPVPELSEQTKQVGNSLR